VQNCGIPHAAIQHESKTKPTQPHRKKKGAIKNKKTTTKTEHEKIKMNTHFEIGI